MLDVEQAIRDYLPDILHMSLATCASNKPWVCEVHFAYDQDLNIYFRSKPSRRHSQEIAKNPNVAGNIVTQHKLGESVRGIYIEGRAEELSNVNEGNLAFRLFQERLKLGSEILEDAKQEDGHKFYKITVSNFYIFDTRESSPAQKYHLQWDKK